MVNLHPRYPVVLSIVAALIILKTGWTAADSLISALIGVFIVPRAWGLLRSVVDVLLESTPRHLDMRQIEAAMRDIPGVESVGRPFLTSPSAPAPSRPETATQASLPPHAGRSAAATSSL